MRMVRLLISLICINIASAAEYPQWFTTNKYSGIQSPSNNWYLSWTNGLPFWTPISSWDNPTNNDLVVSNLLWIIDFNNSINATNQSFLIGNNGTNNDNLYALNNTNFTLLVGSNDTNNGQLFGINATNHDWIIGSNDTNNDNLISLNATNESLLIGSNATNNDNKLSSAATNEITRQINSYTNHVAATNIDSGGTLSLSVIPTLTVSKLSDAGTLAYSNVYDVATVIYRTSTVNDNQGNSGVSNSISFTVFANCMGTNKSITIQAQGDMIQNTSSSTNFTMAFVFGGTTLWSSTVNFAANASRIPWTLNFVMRNVNASNSQVFGGFFTGTRNVPTTGNGGIVLSPSGTTYAGTPYGTSAVDSTADRTCTITTQWASASNNCEFKVTGVTVTCQ